MKDINTSTLIGRLTKDAELHMFSEETGVIQFTLAFNTTTKKDGKFEDVANFIKCKHFGKNMSKLNEMLTKGKQVSVSGYLAQESWEKDGHKNSTILIIAEDIQLLGGGKASSESSQGSQEAYNDFQEDCPF